MTPLAGHQTARLSKGRDTSPEHGTCVMELASMLAGEPFSDAPRSVCPVATGRRWGVRLISGREAADLAACPGAAISERHPSALLLLDELIALGRAEDAVPDALPVPAEPRSGTTWM
jgi:hypothetical protein